jgi:phosphatidate phosphatase APP1
LAKKGETMRTIERFTAPALAAVIAAAAIASVLLSCSTVVAADGPARGQEILFFHSPISVSSDGQWSLTMQGRVYEPPEKSKGRQALIDILAPAVGASSTDKLYRERAGFFLSDSNRNMRVSVKIGEQSFALPPSDPAGYFSAEIALTNSEVSQLAKDGVISFESRSTAANPKRFPGTAALVPEEGIIVVTDMDDTIKVTDILNHDEKIANTFLRPFRAVAGMPELYRSWKEALGPQIHFHVVSAGPWQFHEPLRRFTEEAGFPAFTWDMRSVDIGDIRVLLAELNQNLDMIYDHKLLKIRALMKRFPKRHFVLVGDSGERDPEVYAKIVAEYMDRVDAVFIRNVQREDQAAQQAARYRDLFSTEEAKAKLRVFLDPKELPPLTVQSGAIVPPQLFGRAK